MLAYMQKKHRLCLVGGKGIRRWMVTDEEAPEKSRQHSMISTVHYPPTCLLISSGPWLRHFCGLLKLLMIRSAAHQHQASKNISKSRFYASFLTMNCPDYLARICWASQVWLSSFFLPISTFVLCGILLCCVRCFVIIANHTRAQTCQQETRQCGQRFPCFDPSCSWKHREEGRGFFFWGWGQPAFFQQPIAISIFLTVDPKDASPDLWLFVRGHSFVSNVHTCQSGHGLLQRPGQL